jgi:methyl-accepting chemotaxis protein
MIEISKKRRKRKLLIKILSWLLMLVGIPLILMGLILGYKSNESIQTTTGKITDLSSQSIQSTGESLIGLSTDVISQTNKKSLDISISAIDKASKSLGNIGTEAMKNSTQKILTVTQKEITDNGKVLINLSKENLKTEIIEKNRLNANVVAQEVINNINSLVEVLKFTAKLSDVKGLLPESAQKPLVALQKAYPDIPNIYLANKLGEKITSSSTEDLVDGAGENVSSKSSFKRAVKGGTYISDVQISKRLYPVITVAVPVYLYAGKVIGVLEAEINVSQIDNIINKCKVGKTGYVFIVNNDGRVLFHPNKQLALKRTNLSGLPVVRAVLSENSQAMHKLFRVDGQEVIASGTVIKSLGWGVIAVQPTAEAFAVSKQMEKQVASSTNNVITKILSTSQRNMKDAISKVDLESKNNVKSSVEIMTKNAEELNKQAVEKMKPVAEENTKTAFERIKSESSKTARSAVEAITLSSTLFIIIFVSIAAVLSMMIAKNIANPIQAITQIAAKISRDDLTGNINNTETDDEETSELYSSFSEMQEHIRILVNQIHDNAESLSASAQELTANITEVAKGTEQVSISITEISQGAEKQEHLSNDTETQTQNISEEINQIINKINFIVENTVDAMQKTKLGAEAINNVLAQMDVINAKAAESINNVKALNKKSEEITNILTLITSIAQQTNLLSLNAAIEAARAGEHGRGFAVVAEEIRVLSTQTEEATKQINDIVKEITNNITKVSSSINEEAKVVQEGTIVAADAGKSFETINDSINEVSSQVNEVANSVKNINESVKIVVSSVENISKIAKESTNNTQDVAAIAQEQTASMEEISAFTSELAKMAESLNTAISKYKT